MKSITAASVQFNHKPGDKAYNLSVIEKFVREASLKNADLIIFPEMCITGYWHVRNLSEPEVRSLAESVPSGPSSQALIALAIKHQMTIGAGLIEISEEGDLYNTYIVAMGDGSYAKHRKLHCFISSHMKSGNSYTVFDSPHGVRMGILICYDNNIIENARITALMGAEVLLAPHQTGGCKSASPKAMGLIDPQLWEEREERLPELTQEFLGPKGRGWLMRWLPSRAHDNGMFLIFSNGVGRDDNEVRTGGAMILDPYGEILSETTKAGDDMVVARLDASLLPFSSGQRWMKSRRPNLYGLITQWTGMEEDTRKVRFTFEEDINK